MTNIIDRIKTGTAVRLHPVIMKAAVAYQGFLSIALSTSASKFIAKPLSILFFLSIMLNIVQVQAQDKTITTVEQAIEAALKNHPQIKSKTLQVQQQEHLKEAAYVLPKMDIQAAYGQFNTKTIDQSYAISQSFNPFLAKIKKGLAIGYIAKSELELAMAESELKHHIKTLWDEGVYNLANTQLLEEKKNLYKQYAGFADEAFQKGETGSLEKYKADLDYQNVLMQWKNATTEGEIITTNLEALLMENVEINAGSYKPKEWTNDLKELSIANHPQLKILLKEMEIAKSQSKASYAERKPEFTIGYQAQSIKGITEEEREIVEYDRIPRFHGFDVGIQIPVFGKSYKAQTQATEIDALVKEEEIKLMKLGVESHLNSLQSQYSIQQENLNFYTNTALPNVRQIKKDATEAYQDSTLEFNAYLENMNLYFETMEKYIEVVQSFNQVIFDIEYLVND